MNVDDLVYPFFQIIVGFSPHFFRSGRDNSSSEHRTWPMAGWDVMGPWKHGAFFFGGKHSIMSEQDREIAVALHHFRCIGRQVTQALRKDDVDFFRSLASEVSDFMQPHQTRDFWRVLRRSLPKFRNRKLGQDPHKLEVLQEQWTPYFEKLESGYASSTQQIVGECHERQMQMPVVQGHFVHVDLPSIIELEDAFRTTQADRATGLDPIPSGAFKQHAVTLATAYFPLLLKTCLWQHEPVTSKGGQMAVIYKKGSGFLAENYRGIMLLPSCAKRVPCTDEDKTHEDVEDSTPTRTTGRISFHASSLWIPIPANIWTYHGFTQCILGNCLH